MENTAKNPISEHLLSVLACPLCKLDLKYNKAKTHLVCKNCENEFQIKNGIPILLVSNS